MGRKLHICPHGIVGKKNCKECKREYEKEWYKNHPTRRRRSSLKYVANKVKMFYRKNKLELIKFMGNKCVSCGLMLKDVDGCQNVFVVDEIIPLGIGKRKFTNLTLFHLKEAKKLFLEEKTQLLCQNCSAIKTWKNNDYSARF